MYMEMIYYLFVFDNYNKYEIGIIIMNKILNELNISDLNNKQNIINYLCVED